MSLTLPTNIANRDNCASVVGSIIASMGERAMFRIRGGVTHTHPIDLSNVEGESRLIAHASIVYVLDSTRGRSGPIAAFIDNESLGRVKIQHLVDDEQIEPDLPLPHHTVDMLGVYIRSMFASTNWLNAVNVPTDLSRLNGILDLQVAASGNSSTVTLTDASHRPHSSRRWR